MNHHPEIHTEPCQECDGTCLEGTRPCRACWGAGRIAIKPTRYEVMEELIRELGLGRCL